MSEPITEKDLTYYVDDQLEPARRVEVEAHLARRPELAARIMDELKINHELRLMAAHMGGEPRPDTGDLARRLQGSMARRALLHRLRPSLAVCLLLAVGGLGGSLLVTTTSKPGVPGYVEAALQAHAVSQVRAVMISQPEAPEYDRDELLSATAIVMPTLPPDWSVTDVQVYPSRFGPSVEMAVDAGALGKASIFAARPGDFGAHHPTIATFKDTTLGHWQIGDIAYVLVGTSEPSTILSAAEALADSLY